MKVLITGGAGYIGSFAVHSLIEKGHEVTVFDNLQTGHKSAVDTRAKIIVRSLSDAKAIQSALKGMDAVMHYAGSIDVAESMRQPYKYYDNNLVNGVNLLRAMAKNDVKKIVFSSTAAVYGTPEKIPITEDSKTNPINHYGASKLIFEKAMDAFSHAGITYAALRYFNVAGAAIDGSRGEMHEPETHIIPRTLIAAKNEDEIKIFGTDYSTPDGTCIRDYIHVQDLIDAHILALDYLKNKGKSDVFNLGSQNGYSVREVISSCEKAVGKKIPIKEEARREGDPAVLIASSKKIRESLGWKPKFSLNDITQSAWKWHNRS